MTLATGYTETPTEQERQINRIVAANSGLIDDPESVYWQGVLDDAIRELGFEQIKPDYSRPKSIRQLVSRINSAIAKLKNNYVMGESEARYLANQVIESKERIKRIVEIRKESK